MVVWHLESEHPLALALGAQEAGDGGDAVGVAQPVEDGVGEEEVGFGRRGRGGVGVQVGEGEGYGGEGGACFGEHGGGGVDAGDAGVREAGGEDLGAVAGSAAEVDYAGWGVVGSEEVQEVVDGAVARVAEEKVLVRRPVVVAGLAL